MYRLIGPVFLVMRSFGTKAKKISRHVEDYTVYAQRRVPLHAPDFPIVLLHSEKAGCTSLTKWFLFQIGLLENALQFNPWIHKYRTAILNRQPGYRAEAVRLLGYGDKPIIKLVRNPYTRAISSFLHTLKNARRHEGWELGLINAARQHAGKPQGIEPSLSFRDFLRFLPAMGTALGRINGHIAQQYVPAEAGRITRTIRVERFKEEIRQIEAEFGLAASPLDRIMSSRHHRSAFQQQLASHCHPADLDITSAAVRQGQAPHYESLYDFETQILVRECFALDFLVYGYDQ